MATQLVTKIAEAIKRKEGWYPGSLAYRNNNPGNLRSWGSNPVVNGYAQFPTYDAGWAALTRQVELNIGRGLTLEEFFAGKPGVYSGYAPSADSNNPVLYAQNVSQWTGIPLGVPLNTINPNTLATSTLDPVTPPTPSISGEEPEVTEDILTTINPFGDDANSNAVLWVIGGGFALYMLARLMVR